MATRLISSTVLLALVVCGGAVTGARAVGGSGGTPFSMQCSATQHLTAVRVRSGKRIDALGIECAGPGSRLVRRYGGDGGTAHTFDVEGSDVVEIRGWRGTCGKKSRRICALRFATRKADGNPLELSPQYGEWSSGADAFTLRVSEGRELYGFSGRSGNELDNIELLTRPS